MAEVRHRRGEPLLKLIKKFTKVLETNHISESFYSVSKRA